MSQLFAYGGWSVGASASAITPSNDYSGLISFNIDWFDLLAVQGSLKSLLLITTILKHQFFSTQPSLMVQLSDLYMTTGKTKALTTWTVISKVMPQLSNVLCRFLITFLPRNKHLLISWLLSESTVILELKLSVGVYTNLCLIWDYFCVWLFFILNGFHRVSTFAVIPSPFGDNFPLPYSCPPKINGRCHCIHPQLLEHLMYACSVLQPL